MENTKKGPERRGRIVKLSESERHAHRISPHYFKTKSFDKKSNWLYNNSCNNCTGTQVSQNIKNYGTKEQH